jgi:hypothetical protein
MANFTIKKINDQGGFRRKLPTIPEMSKEVNEDYCSQIIRLNFCIYVCNETFIVFY